MDKIPDGIHINVYNSNINQIKIIREKSFFKKYKSKYFKYGQICVSRYTQFSLNKILYTETGLKFICIGEIGKKHDSCYYSIQFLDTEHELEINKILTVIVPYNTLSPELIKEFG